MFRIIKNKIQPKTKHFVKWIQGFSAVEYIVAALLLAIIFVNVGKLLVSAITNGNLLQKAADSNDLATRKATALFNDAKNQIAKIPANQNQVGSIDPNQPVEGYFDLFNESGCLLNSPKIKLDIDPGGDKGGSGGGALGGPTGGTKGASTSPTGDEAEVSRIDCSTSNYTKPSQSLLPKFRRQWLVKKDFPNPKDTTFVVIVAYTNNNTIARSYVVTKSDGITGK